MLYRNSLLVLILLFLSAFGTADQSDFVHITNESFERGEEIEFKMSFGFFTVGKGKMKIHPTLHRINYRDSYRIDICGKTSGMIDWLARVDDNWGAYVDTASLVPQI